MSIEKIEDDINEGKSFINVDEERMTPNVIIINFKPLDSIMV